MIRMIRDARTMLSMSSGWMRYLDGIWQTSPRRSARTDFVLRSPPSGYVHVTLAASKTIKWYFWRNSWKRSMKMHSQRHGFSLKYSFTAK